MRLLATITPADQGLQFSLFLKEQGIVNTCDVVQNNDWGSKNYGIPSCEVWIKREEDVPRALEWFDQFQNNRNDPIFQISPSQLTPHLTKKTEENDDEDEEDEPFLHTQTISPPPRTNYPLGPITLYIILTCIWIFTWQLFTAPDIKKLPPQFPPTAIASPEITLQLLYDYPKSYEIAHDLVTKYGVEPFWGEKPLPEEGIKAYRLFLATPIWQGIYPDIIAFARGEFKKEPPKTVQGPLFEKIREGEIWRLVTPIFLHGNILHILFNMLWLVMLGKQMERRLSPGKYIFFILISAIFSNTCQYILSGPNFIGYSGVLCAMIVFIWMRQRYYPWEGYHLDKANMALISLFVLGILALQILVFFVEAFSSFDFALGIANTAHLAGAFIGFVFAQIKSYHKTPKGIE